MRSKRVAGFEVVQLLSVLGFGEATGISMSEVRYP